MSLKATLADGQQLLVENKEGQTHITLHSGGDGSKQSQGDSFQTGEWSKTPVLSKTKDGFVLQIEADGKTHSFQLQNNAIDQLDNVPSLAGAEDVSLEKASDEEIAKSKPEPMKPMTPMKPMEPMKPM